MRVFGFEISRRKSQPAARFLGDIAKIEVKDGDVFVLMHPARMSEEDAAFIRQTWQAIFGQQVTLLILDAGARLGVLSPVAAAQVNQAIEDGAAVGAALGKH